MEVDTRLRPELCNCLALRQAARHVTQFYDRFLAMAGLRTTQFSILAKLRRLGPMTISALAADLVMDRTTLGRNLQPLEREGLVAVVTGRADRRSREVRLTDAGAGSKPKPGSRRRLGSNAAPSCARCCTRCRPASWRAPASEACRKSRRARYPVARAEEHRALRNVTFPRKMQLYSADPC